MTGTQMAMTEYELVMSITELHELAAQAMVNYMTVISGFLITSYAIGAKLTRWQMRFLTFIFVFFALFCILGSVGYFATSVPLMQELATRSSYINGYLLAIPPHVIVGVLELFGIIGCLLFLRDIRHSAQRSHGS